MKVIIRPLSSNDSVKFTNFHNSIIKEGVYILEKTEKSIIEENRWIKKQLSGDISRRKLILVAVKENVIAGMIEISRSRGFENHIGTLYILLAPEFRSQGIGTKLLKKALTTAKKELGIKIIRLFVRKENKIAIGLYKKLGFSKYGCLPNGIKSNKKYYDSILMYKNI